MNQFGALWKIVPLRMPKTLGDRTGSTCVPSAHTSRPCTLVGSPLDFLAWSSYPCTSSLLLPLSILRISARLLLTLVSDEGCSGTRSRVDLRSFRQEQLNHPGVHRYTVKFATNRACNIAHYTSWSIILAGIPHSVSPSYALACLGRLQSHVLSISAHSI